MLITSHGKPRAVVMSVEEFRRLKAKAGEPVPAEAEPKAAATLRAADDPLGYDVSDFRAAALRMAEDFKSGRTREAIDAELARVRKSMRAAHD